METIESLKKRVAEGGDTMLSDVFGLATKTEISMSDLSAAFYSMMPELAFAWKQFLLSKGIKERFWSVFKLALAGDRDAIEQLVEDDEVDDDVLNNIIEAGFFEAKIAKQIVEKRSVESVRLSERQKEMKGLMEGYRDAKKVSERNVFLSKLSQFDLQEVYEFRKLGVIAPLVERYIQYREGLLKQLATPGMVVGQAPTEVQDPVVSASAMPEKVVVTEPVALADSPSSQDLLASLCFSETVVGFAQEPQVERPAARRVRVIEKEPQVERPAAGRVRVVEKPLVEAKVEEPEPKQEQLSLAERAAKYRQSLRSRADHYRQKLRMG